MALQGRRLTEGCATFAFESLSLVAYAVVLLTVGGFPEDRVASRG